MLPQLFSFIGTIIILSGTLQWDTVQLHKIKGILVYVLTLTHLNVFMSRVFKNNFIYLPWSSSKSPLFSLHDQLMFLGKQFTKRSLKINPDNELYYAVLNHSHYCPVTCETSYRLVSLFFFISQGNHMCFSRFLRTIQLPFVLLFIIPFCVCYRSSEELFVLFTYTPELYLFASECFDYAHTSHNNQKGLRYKNKISG
jgi:hypothetical protein